MKKEEALKHIELIRKHLESGNHEKANVLLQNLHKKLPGLEHHVAREAITGEGKFANQEGKATHVVSIGKNARVWNVDEFMHEHHNYIKPARASAGKHGGSSTAVRMDVPKIPKRKKES